MYMRKKANLYIFDCLPLTYFLYVACFKLFGVGTHAYLFVYSSQKSRALSLIRALGTTVIQIGREKGQCCGYGTGMGLRRFGVNSGASFTHL